ncbi:MAG: hypothetical protein LBG59_00245 [Candidatus Peribacteria bacterium]|nr:hypothetical protein [Candidatus Peribacteria bacterium]
MGSGNAYAIYGVTGTHIEFHNLHLRNSTNSAINLTVPHIKFFTININTGGGFVAQDNWKIEGLIMDNANTIYIRGYNIQLRNVYISNSKGGGIVIGYSAIVADNISLDTVVVSGCAEKLTGDTSVGL